MSDLIIDTTNMKNLTLDNSLESSSEIEGGGGGGIGGESLKKKKEDENFIPACRVAEVRNIGKCNGDTNNGDNSGGDNKTSSTTCDE